MLEIFSVNNKKEFDEVVNYINDVSNQIYDDRLNYCLKNIRSELAKVIFLDWWYGGCLWDNKDGEVGLCGQRVSSRYKYVPKEDWEEAYEYIMITVSMGMG